MTSNDLAYGGVVVDAEGKFLLRRPTKYFGGYAWTFAKGRPRPWQTPEQAALCEVEEETGWICEIVQKIPGLFEGSTTTTEFFLMRPVRDTGHFDQETEQIVWASLDEAKELIAETPNPTGRQRDLTVLEATIRLVARTHDARSATATGKLRP